MKSNMVNTYIYYIIYGFLFILIQHSIMGMPHQQRNVCENNAYPESENNYQQQLEAEQKAKEEAEKKRLEEELNAFAEELLQHEESEKEKLETEVHDNLALLNDKEEKKATVIFEIPDKWQVYALSNQEKARLKELFEIYSVEAREQYVIIKFRYKDGAILPQTEDQAIYLLYSSHVKDGQIKPFNYLNEPALNQLQKKLSNFKPNKESKTLAEEIAEHKDSKKERLEKNPTFQVLKKIFNSTNYEGLPGSTKVKTELGYRTIDQLKIGDLIACYDTKNAKEECCKVINVQKLTLTRHIQIIIGDQTLKVAHKHEFYVKSLDKYVTALDLKDNLDLRKLVNENIKDVKEVKEPLAVIRIRVDPNHNFYITEHDILVHNFIIPIVIQGGVSWGPGMAAWTWNVLVPTITAIGTALVYWLGNKLTGQNKQSPPPQPQATFTEQEQQSGIYVQRVDGTFFKADMPNPAPQATPNSNKGKNNKLPEEISEGAKPGRETKGGAKQYEKPGGYEDAVKDFDKLNPTDIRDIPTGKRGTLPDGRSVNVRYKSEDGRPTLEIQNPNRTSIKIRYGDKIGK